MIQAAEVSPTQICDPQPASAPRFRAINDDVTPFVARIEALEAELAAMKAGMVQRTGQRFVSGEGEVVTITAFDDSTPGYPWVGVSAKGVSNRYGASGESLIGQGRFSWANLVGPAPDELAEAKKDAQSYLDELKVAMRERDQFRAALGERLATSDLKALSPEAYVDLLENMESALGPDELRWALEQAVRENWRADPRAEAEGFGPSLEPQLFVAISTPPEVRLAPLIEHLPDDPDFVARRVETGDRGLALYAIERA